MPKIDFIQILLNILGHVRLHSKHSISKLKKIVLRDPKLGCQRVKRKIRAYCWNYDIGVLRQKLVKNDQNRFGKTVEIGISRLELVKK